MGLIGRGAFGYVSTCPGNSRVVCKQFYSPNDAREEVEIVHELKRLPTWPKCVVFCNVRIVQGKPAVFMPRMSHTIDRSSRLNPRNVCLDLLECVTKLSRLGYVHTDLKPRNVLVDVTARLVLADVGSIVRLSGSRVPFVSTIVTDVMRYHAEKERLCEFTYYVPVSALEQVLFSQICVTALSSYDDKVDLHAFTEQGSRSRLTYNVHAKIRQQHAWCVSAIYRGGGHTFQTARTVCDRYPKFWYTDCTKPLPQTWIWVTLACTNDFVRVSLSIHPAKRSRERIQFLRDMRRAAQAIDTMPGGTAEKLLGYKD